MDGKIGIMWWLGQHLPFIKKNLSSNSFNLEKSLFLSKIRKNIRFYPNYCILNYNYIICIIYRIKIRSFDSTTLYKRKETSLHTIYNQKKIIFLQNQAKSQKYSFLIQKCAIPIVFELTKMINSEIA